MNAACTARATIRKVKLIGPQAPATRVPVRQQPWKGSRLVAANTAVAMRISGHRAGVYLTPTGADTRTDGGILTVPAEGLTAARRWHRHLGHRPPARDGDLPDNSFVAIDVHAGSNLNIALGLVEFGMPALVGMQAAMDPVRWVAPLLAPSLITRGGSPWCGRMRPTLPCSGHRADALACRVPGIGLTPSLAVFRASG